MVKITLSDNFQKRFSKLKDAAFKERIEKLIIKIKENPEIGKPMRFERKGTREVYAGSFRLSYSFDKNADMLFIYDFYHKDNQ